MSKAFSFTIEGSERLLKRLTEYSKRVQDDVAVEIEDSAREIERKAIERAPANKSDALTNKQDANKDGYGYGSTLRAGIVASEIDKFTWQVTSNALYSAYVEFGTGTYVFFGEPWITPELKAYAAEFKTSGKGRIYPQPFLFNSFMEEQKALIERIKKILNNG